MPYRRFGFPTLPLRAAPTLALLAIAAAWTLTFAPVARAQTRTEPTTLASDRPGLGDAAHVMAPGAWQVELGGTIWAEETDEFLVGSSLVRFGFAPLEVRLFVPNFVALHQGEFLRLGDLGVGVKVPLGSETSAWRWAATGLITLPTGAESLTAHDPGGGASIIGQTGLGASATLAVNAGYGFVFNDLGGGTLSLLVTPTFDVPGQQGLSAFVGWAGYLREGDDAHYIEGGLAKLDGADRQWDVNAGYDPGAHVWFLGVGVAQRGRR